MNNCIKRHINIPTYSVSSENVYLDEYVQGAPMYQQPYMYNQNMINQQMNYNPNQYQGNVGTEGMQQQFNYQGYKNFNPMNTTFNY